MSKPSERTTRASAIPMRFTIFSFSYFGVVAVFFIFTFADVVHADEADLRQLMNKMEQDVIDFAIKVENVYQEERCSISTLVECKNNNYDACMSQYPSQSCPGGDQLTIERCDDGQKSCGALFDTSVSTVRLPRFVATGTDGNPEEKKVIETVCYTRKLDEWMKDKYNSDKTFWSKYNVDAPQMQFGASDGTFRILPARHNTQCGTYDPRKRPWYVAASSGPKNIVLVLDTSGSMFGATGHLLSLMKEAATLIIQTLALGDRVAIVEFNTNARLVADPNDNLMFVANEKNKETLIDIVENFEADGKTNFYDAFSKAFDVLDETIEDEKHVPCHSAILFLTDGVMTEPKGMNETEVIDLITRRKAEIEESTRHPLFIFTYSIGDSLVHTLPKEIACSTGGVWSKIDDADELVPSMASYYKLFALGLRESRNEDFTAWVEPYNFFTGGTLGTTVSAPVYDRSVDPPQFIGVVGIDFTMAAMDKALGVKAGSAKTLNRVVQASIATCPTLRLSLCELESFRRQGVAGNDAICTDNCTDDDFFRIEPEQCSAVEAQFYPTYLWDNTNYRGMSYEERVCCKVGEDVPSDECPVLPIAVIESINEEDDNGGGLSTGAIIGIVVAGIVVVGCLVALTCRQKIKKGEEDNEVVPQNVPPTSITSKIPPVPPPKNYDLGWNEVERPWTMEPDGI